MRRPAPDPIYSLRGSSSALSFLKFQGNETLYSGNYDGAVFEWSMETRRVVSNFSAHPGHSILYLDFSNDSHLITHGRDGLVKIWAKNETGMRQNGELKCSDTGFCGSCLLADGTLAVPGFNQSEVDVYDLNTVKVISQLKHDNSNKKCGEYNRSYEAVLEKPCERDVQDRCPDYDTIN
ncbi:guanine nucleotide-binding protein subunit beta-like protein 1 homolog isoform X5 [Mercenaria mercenaria]|uniref:guanine nucleotide-binding protein subunit beta-like protein 1 homolog isoform X5 n=1 Tax=Mercenaria mercenaria TaxID=6596 RepID=UPI001E1E02D3|nr:guanine nucleotide-binding protein subunit beta-like protein 1 homolog isoform X5 [Mercenaria mercenaria]